MRTMSVRVMAVTSACLACLAACSLPKGSSDGVGGDAGAGGPSAGGDDGGGGGGSGSAGDASANLTGQCPGYDPNKNVYWGNLHQHTGYSADAYLFGTRATPTDAYLYAKGGPAVDPKQKGPLKRPLDFLAITDHSEWLMVTHGCTVDPQSGYYNSNDCGLVRSPKVVDEDAVFAELGTLRKNLLTNDAAAATMQEQSAWQDIIKAANTAYEPCAFTSLVAYEWTDTRPVTDMATMTMTNVTNHRNVIFTNDHVPQAPLDSVDFPKPPDLWTALDAQCTAAMGCDVVTIPHNTNLSAGVSLVVWDPSAKGIAQQEHYQVSAEIYQHKGASECYYDPATGYNDADCQFEQRYGGKAVNLGPQSFVRTGIGTGLGYAAQNPSGGNPLKLGIVGATDDHNGAPGNVDDATYVGHAGKGDDLPLSRLTKSPENGSGAITGAWAEQNTRESIFAAIKRRETFATSGPRISVRFYQTKDGTACADPAFPKKIIDAQDAVPMGGTIGPSAVGGSAPTFALTAWPDATPQHLGDGTMGVAGFARVQIIKVRAHMKAGVQVIVEDPPNALPAFPAMGGCVTWQDPSFDPTEYAAYYVRAIQVPTFRWSHYACQTVMQNNPNTWMTLVPNCAPGGTLDVTEDERAWTSPIFFEP